MPSQTWYLSQKPRVRKKYTLLFNTYVSPKTIKKIYKDCLKNGADKAFCVYEKGANNEDIKTN